MTLSLIPQFFYAFSLPGRNIEWDCVQRSFFILEVFIMVSKDLTKVMIQDEA